MASETDALAADELALLDRLAVRVVELHMEIPAILTLETGKPLALVAGQTLVFFEPMVQALFSFPDYRRVAGLVERRAAIEALIRMIEEKADRSHARRRAAKSGARPDPPARPPGPTPNA